VTFDFVLTTNFFRKRLWPIYRRAKKILLYLQLFENKVLMAKNKKKFNAHDGKMFCKYIRTSTA